MRYYDIVSVTNNNYDLSEDSTDGGTSAGSVASIAKPLTGSVEDNEQKPLVIRRSQSIIEDDTSDITDNPAFKAWFRDSKVVDKNGNPLVVYHGSEKVFDVFDDQFIGQTGTMEGNGFYFTPDIDKSKMFGDTIYSVYLSIQKPLSWNRKTITKANLKKLINAVAREDEFFLSNYGDENDLGYQTVLNTATNMLYDYNNTDIDLVHDIFNSAGRDRNIFKILTKSLGYDGIFVPANDKGSRFDIWVAFYPGQIKTVKNTTFNVDSDNIHETFD